VAAGDGGQMIDAPLVEASLEPGPLGWDDGHPTDIADAEIIDAEIIDPEVVGEDGMIVAPRDGAHDSDLPASPKAGGAIDAAADGEASGLAAVTWPCKCGEVVSFEETSCPVCGASFLGDLRDGAGGRHRPGHAALNWLPESRQVRLAAAAFIAIFIAVFVPVIISLFG
jgi:hypothetical protein